MDFDVSQPMNHNVSQPIGQDVTHPIDHNVSQSIDHNASQSMEHNVSHPIDHDVSFGLPNTIMPVEMTTKVPETNTLTVSPPVTSFALAGTPTTDRKCIVCYDRDPNAFYFPCGHTSCLVCALHLKTNGSRCPHCRENIQKIKSIFNDFDD